jgi:hypothetical protein
MENGVAKIAIELMIAIWRRSYVRATAMQLTRSLLSGALGSVLLGTLVGVSAKAVPIVSSLNPNRLLSVADGCGFNKYRDARGICRPKYVIERCRSKSLYGGVWRYEFVPCLQFVRTMLDGL